MITSLPESFPPSGAWHRTSNDAGDDRPHRPSRAHRAPDDNEHLRFVIEFFKDVQENFEITQVLNMGQRLSIPFILAGVFMLWYSKRLPDTGTKIPETGKKSR